MPIRPLPIRPSLERDRKNAKRLLRAARALDPEALSRIATRHPRFRTAAEIRAADLRLADVELVLAREYGFPSWPRYAHFVQATLADRATRAALLTRAVCGNQLARGLALLDREPELARFDPYAACACGELEVVRTALERDPALARAAGGASGWEPLVYVCFSRFWRRDAARAARLLAIAELLLEHGASPNAYYLSDDHEHRVVQTCLYAAAGIANSPALTRALLAAGADVDEMVEGRGAQEPEPKAEQMADWLRRHPLEALYHATEFKDVACLRLLLETAPMPFAVSYCLGRALDFDNDAATLLYLEHGADVGLVVPWRQGRGHLHKAVMNRRSQEVIRALLERGADPNQPDATGTTPYGYALRRRERSIAALLEQFGARSEPGANGATRLPDAELLVRAARRNAVAEIRELLEAGLDVDAPADFSPLHGACYAGQLAAARLLLERGASIEQKNAYGGSPLDSVVHGSANCCDPEGGPGTLSPEEIPARDYAELAQFLIERGAALPPSVNGGSEAVQEVLRRHGVPDEGQSE